jgi:hypothetical protein
MAQALDADELRIVVERNRSADAGICHSHDFIDANEMMIEAFREAFGREPELTSDEDMREWDQAWNEAKSAGFNVSC